MHEILWRAAADLTTPDCDKPLPALLLTHAAFEAYINYLGARVAPEVWANERARFTATPYRGVLGKVNWLCEMLGVEQDWGAEPWQSLKALDSWRNQVVHGKDADTRGLLSHYSVERVAGVRKAAARVCEQLYRAIDIPDGDICPFSNK